MSTTRLGDPRRWWAQLPLPSQLGAGMMWNVLGQGSFKYLQLRAGRFHTLPYSAETSGCLLPEILKGWHFAFLEAYSSQETLRFRVSCGEGMCLPTFSQKCLCVHYPDPQISPASPVVPACASHLEQSVMLLSTLQALYTAKQTNRDPNTPQQAYCQRISSHAGAARRIQLRIAYNKSSQANWSRARAMG